MVDKDEPERRKVEVSPELLQKIRGCAAVPKLVAVLVKANLIGQSEFSAFYDPKRKKMPLKGMARWRAIVQSNKFRESAEKWRNE